MHMSDLENCIELYGRDIYSFCCCLTRSRQAADDLYQDAFLTAAEIIGRLDAEGNLKSALLSIAVNLWRNRCRKLSLRQRITGPVASLELLRETGGVHAAAGTWCAGGSHAAAGAWETRGFHSATGAWETRGGPDGGSTFPAAGSFSGGEPVSGTPSLLDAVIAREEAQTIRQAVAALPDRYRLPVLLFYMEDLKIPEIAAVLQIPQGTVKSRLHKARKRLAQDLKEVLDET